MKTPIVVMASGSGTNFEAIADAVRSGRLDAEILAVMSDRPDSAVLEKAARRGIRGLSIPFEKAANIEDARSLHDERILSAVLPLGPRFLVMAGYMRIVSRRLIEAFRSENGYARIVNIHPSLLPAFPGIGGYSQAFRYGAKVAGVSVHLVEEEVDVGPICGQESFSIAGCRSESEVEELGKKIEHRLYPEVLSWVLPEKFEVTKNRRRLCVRPH